MKEMSRALIATRIAAMFAGVPMLDTSMTAKMGRAEDVRDAVAVADRVMFGQVDKVIHEFDRQGQRREEMARMSSLTLQPLNRPNFQKNESKQRAKQRGRKR